MAAKRNTAAALAVFAAGFGAGRIDTGVAIPDAKSVSGMMILAKGDPGCGFAGLDAYANTKPDALNTWAWQVNGTQLPPDNVVSRGLAALVANVPMQTDRRSTPARVVVRPLQDERACAQVEVDALVPGEWRPQ